MPPRLTLLTCPEVRKKMRTCHSNACNDDDCVGCPLHHSHRPLRYLISDGIKLFLIHSQCILAVFVSASLLLL